MANYLSKHYPFALVLFLLIYGFLQQTGYLPKCPSHQMGGLSDRTTSNGVTELDIKRSGMYNTDSNIGCYAGDRESYLLFKDIFDPIIESYHGLNPNEGVNHIPLFDLFEEGKSKKTEQCVDNPFELTDKTNRIKSIRVRLARNIRYGDEKRRDVLPSGMTMFDFILVEKQVSEALLKHLEGEYIPFPITSLETVEILREEHALFDNKDRFLASAGIFRHWPNGRGIWKSTPSSTTSNLTKNNASLVNTYVWINEEDHIRISSIAQGNFDFHNLLEQLAIVLQALEREVEFLHTPTHGYLTSCPTNLGTAMRVSLMVDLPELATSNQLLPLCKSLGLSVRGTQGEHSKVEGFRYDISNKRRFGISESTLLRETLGAFQTLLDAENELQKQML